MSGLSHIADCASKCGLSQVGQGRMIFNRTLQTFWNDHSDSSDTSWCSALQPLPKHKRVVRRWPWLTCLQIFLWVGMGYGGQL